MLWWIALYLYILHRRYAKAKEEDLATEFLTKLINRYLWVITGLLLIYSVVIGYSAKSLDDNLSCLRWEAVFLAFLGMMISPVFVRQMWKISKVATVILPIFCAMLNVFYIPYSTGCGPSDTISLIGLGVVSIFAVGVSVVIAAIIAVILLLFLIGLLTIPVVYVID